MSEEWQFTKIVANGKTFDVVTKPLGNPVDRLARKAMGCAEEQFAGLSKKEALIQGAKFEKWRNANESGRRKRADKSSK